MACPSDRESRILKFAGLVILLNLFIALLKWLIGIKVDSISIKTDAIHSLSDALTTVVVIIGVTVARKAPDKEHPYGHGRAEVLSGFTIAILVALMGFEFLFHSIKRLISPEPFDFPLIFAFFLIIIGLLKDLMSYLSKNIGESLQSPGLIADAGHHRVDALTTYLVAIGLIFERKFPYLDGLLGIIVALYVLKMAYELLKTTSSALLGEPPPERIVKLIEHEAEGFKDIEGLKDIKVHAYGDHYEISFTIKMKGEYSLKKAHEIATLLEEKIKSRIKGSVTIHVEPI